MDHPASPRSSAIPKRALSRLLCLVLAALALSGCVIEPLPYHHWGPRYYY